MTSKRASKTELPVKKSSRKLQEEDIEAIARLTVERRLTVKDACIYLGIDYNSFNCWLYRHNRTEKFAQVVSRLKSSRIDGLIKNIEEAGSGSGNHKRADWRASAWILQFALPDSQFLPNQSTTSNQIIATDSRVLADIISKVYSPQAEPSKVAIDSQAKPLPAIEAHCVSTNETDDSKTSQA